MSFLLPWVLVMLMEVGSMNMLLDSQNERDTVVTLFLQLRINLVSPLVKGCFLWDSLLSTFLEKLPRVDWRLHECALRG